jgi:hypothetical protein
MFSYNKWQLCKGVNLGSKKSIPKIHQFLGLLQSQAQKMPWV